MFKTKQSVVVISNSATNVVARHQSIKFFQTCLSYAAEISAPGSSEPGKQTHAQANLRLGSLRYREIILGCPAPFFLFYRNSRGLERGRGEGGYLIRVSHRAREGESAGKPALWNRNNFLRFRFRFRLLKCYGSGSGSNF